MRKITARILRVSVGDGITEALPTLRNISLTMFSHKKSSKTMLNSLLLRISSPAIQVVSWEMCHVIIGIESKMDRLSSFLVGVYCYLHFLLFPVS